MRTTNEINKLGPRRHDLSKRRTFGICPALENLRLTIADRQWSDGLHSRLQIVSPKTHVDFQHLKAPASGSCRPGAR
jgi:hypothetical protein